MAKKDNDNFDFETEGKAKVSLNLDFLKNLTKQQKGIILAAIVGVVLVIAIVVTCIALGANNNNNSGNNGGSNGGSNSDDVVSEINIGALPTKLSYYVGDEPNYSGLVLSVVENGFDTNSVSYDSSFDKMTITGFDSSQPIAEQTITVEYMGKTTSFVIEIKEIPSNDIVLESIHLDPLPKTTYKLGDSLSVSGAMIVCTYSDGSTVSVPLLRRYTSGFNGITEAGEYEIKVYYHDDNGGYAETSFTITVTE